MVQSSVDEILQENLDKNICAKVDTNGRHEDENFEELYIDTELCEIE